MLNIYELFQTPQIKTEAKRNSTLDVHHRI